MRTLLFVLLFPALCFAADWKRLGDYTDWSYDAASIHKNGEMAEITLFYTRDRRKWDGEIVPASVDCHGGRIAIPNGKLPDAVAASAYDTACKGAWEFWK